MGSERPVLNVVHHPAQDRKATMLVVPGYADHAGRYGHVAAYLNARGIEVFAVDLRGHGKSGGRRGHIESFADYQADVLTALEGILQSGQREALFLLGHSLGGLVTLSALAHHALPLTGAVLSSPFLGLAMPVPPVKRGLARMLSTLIPAVAMPSNIPPQYLARDPAVGVRYSADPLVFKTATARWFTETMAAIDRVSELAPSVDLPLLVLQAGDDRIADPAATASLVKKLGSKDATYEELAGYYHEILNDPEAETVMDRIASWVLSRSQ